MEGRNVLFRVGFESRLVFESVDKLGTMIFAPPVVSMKAKAEAGVPGHAPWLHILV